jgi:hypothetical protein
MAPDVDLDAASLSHPGRIPAERVAALEKLGGQD